MQKKIDDNYNRIVEEVASSKSALIKSKTLYELGLCSRDISDLVKVGKLEKIKQGNYKLVEFNQNGSEAMFISLLYPDGILCMYSALFYYGYSDRTPLEWDIAIDRNVSKARFNIDYPFVNPHYIDKRHLSYGVVEIEYEGFTMNVFDRDRLICECIKHERKMDKEIYNKAIRAYINDNKKDVSKLIEYSKQRNIQNKVKERIGVWL